MRLVAFLLLLAAPLLELALMIKLGQKIGFWPLMLIIFATAIGGMAIVRAQGTGVFRRMMASAAAGTPPVEPALEGTLLLFAGGLLISPGPIGDTIGLLLLIPPLRQVCARWLAGRLGQSGSFTFDVRSRRWESKTEPEPPRDAFGRRPRSDIVIEGEYERIDEPDRSPPTGRREPDR